MSIAEQWRAIRASLRAVPGVDSTLRRPATAADLGRWSRAIDAPLPDQLVEMYAVHDGSSVINANGFCMVGGRTPLPVDKAIERFRRYDTLTRLWGLPTAVPFAVDYTGCLLAVRPSGTGGVLDCFDDSPPRENAFVDVEDLLAQTAAGLRGEHPQYRCELTPDYLLWIDRDEEEEDLGRRV